MSALTEETLYSAGSLAGLTPTNNQLKPSKRAAETRPATFRVVFWGQCASGYLRDNVMQDVAQRFKIGNRRQLEQLFSGQVRTLKKGINEAQADKYVNALRQLGCICRKESEFKDYFSETEFRPRNTVSFLEDDFDPSKLSLAPKDEFSPQH